MNLAVSGSLGLYVGRFGGVASYVSRDTCAKGGEGSSSITPSHLGRQGVVAQPIIVTIRGTGWVAVGGGGDTGRWLSPGVVTVMHIQGRVSPHSSILSMCQASQVVTARG